MSGGGGHSAEHGQPGAAALPCRPQWCALVPFSARKDVCLCFLGSKEVCSAASWRSQHLKRSGSSPLEPSMSRRLVSLALFASSVVGSAVAAPAVAQTVQDRVPLVASVSDSVSLRSLLAQTAPAGSDVRDSDEQPRPVPRQGRPQPKPQSAQSGDCERGGPGHVAMPHNGHGKGHHKGRSGKAHHKGRPGKAHGHKQGKGPRKAHKQGPPSHAKAHGKRGGGKGHKSR